MKVRALVTFSGSSVSMVAGDVGEITDTPVAKDLLKAGYVEKVDEKKKKGAKKE